MITQEGARRLEGHQVCVALCDCRIDDADVVCAGHPTPKVCGSPSMASTCSFPTPT